MRSTKFEASAAGHTSAHLEEGDCWKVAQGGGKRKRPAFCLQPPKVLVRFSARVTLVSRLARDIIRGFPHLRFKKRDLQDPSLNALLLLLPPPG